MKKTVYAVHFRRGTEIERQELGRVIFDEFGRLTPRQYNNLKRKITLTARRGDYIRLLTDDGQHDTFGGYPAYTFVRFE